jgi:hypothetical protein
MTEEVKEGEAAPTVPIEESKAEAPVEAAPVAAGGLDNDEDDSEDEKQPMTE